MWSKNDIDRILLSEEDLRKRVEQMGEQITADYAGKDLLMICILQGSIIFTADLSRKIDLPIETDSMSVSSYGDAAVTSGSITIHKDVRIPVEGRHVLLIEDVIDSGITIKSLVELLEKRNPASLEVAAMLRKQNPEQVDVDVRYVGFECPDEFLVGYGLDYAQRYRTLPYVGVLKPEVYGG